MSNLFYCLITSTINEKIVKRSAQVQGEEAITNLISSSIVPYGQWRNMEVIKKEIRTLSSSIKPRLNKYIGGALICLAIEEKKQNNAIQDPF